MNRCGGLSLSKDFLRHMFFSSFLPLGKTRKEKPGNETSEAVLQDRVKTLSLVIFRTLLCSYIHVHCMHLYVKILRSLIV